MKEVKLKMFHKIFILYLFVFLQTVFSYEINKENVKFLLDSWKYNFGWKTLGGGYVRHILIFTKSHIIDIETKEISNTPGYSKIFFDPLESFETWDSFENLTTAQLAIVFNVILEKLLPQPEKIMDEEIKKIIELASKEPTPENFINAIKTILKGSELSQIWEYSEIEDIKIKRKGDKISLKFKFNNKKYEFISQFQNKEKIVIVESTLKTLLETKEHKDNEKNYLSVYTHDVKDKKEYAKSTVYIELFGQGISINYDYRFHPNFSFRIGSGFAIYAFSLPVTLNLLTGSKTPHHIELGFGFILVGYKDLGGVVPTANLGYRFQPKNGGFFFKIAWTPIIPVTSNFDEGKVWSGLSIGYTF